MLQFMQLFRQERSIQKRLGIDQLCKGSFMVTTMLVLLSVPNKRGPKRTMALKKKTAPDRGQDTKHQAVVNDDDGHETGRDTKSGVHRRIGKSLDW